MKVETQKSFDKDIEKITDKKLAASVIAVIEALENCKSLTEIHHLKKNESQRALLSHSHRQLPAWAKAK